MELAGSWTTVPKPLVVKKNAYLRDEMELAGYWATAPNPWVKEKVYLKNEIETAVPCSWATAPAPRV